MASAVPPTWTVLVVKNPVPLMVRMSGPEPAVTVVGLMLLTVGAGVVVLPPPEFEEDPDPLPQPSRRIIPKRPRKNRFVDFTMRA